MTTYIANRFRITYYVGDLLQEYYADIDVALGRKNVL